MPRSRAYPAWVLVVLAAALLSVVRSAGTEPALWDDTSADEHYVRSCLDAGRCVLAGPAASVGALRIGVTWIQVRAVLSAAGLSLVDVLWVMHGLAALGTALAGALAWRVRGPLAAALAVVAVRALLDLSDIHLDVVYSNRLFFFLGVAALAAGVSARGGRLRDLLPAAAVVAVATEVHPICGLMLIPVAGLALASPRPVVATAAVVLAYGVLLFALAPAAWAWNLDRLFGDFASRLGAQDPVAWSEMLHLPALLAAVASIVLVVAAGTRAGAGTPARRDGLLLLGYVAPPVVVLIVAVLAGAVTATDKYLGTWLPAIAVALGWGIDRLLGGAGDRPWSRWGVALAPWVAAGIVAAWPPGAARPVLPGAFDLPTFPEVAQVGGRLQARGWSVLDAVARLKGPGSESVAHALTAMDPWEGGAADPGAAAVLVKTCRRKLPEPVPPWMEEVAVDGREVTTLSWFDSWIDATRYRACVVASGAEPVCADGVFRVADRGLGPQGTPLAAAGLPGMGAAGVEAVRLHLEVRAGGSGEHRLALPPLAAACNGRVLAVPEGSEILEGQRSARLVSPPGGTGEVVLEWRPGSPDCPRWAFRGLPPLWIEGDRDRVEVVADLLAAGGCFR